MAEEQKEPQQITKEPQQVMKEPQRVTTKNPRKVEAGKRLAAHNCKKKEEKRKEQPKLEKTAMQRSKPILRNWACYSSGRYRWSWLLHLSNQERTSIRSQ